MGYICIALKTRLVISGRLTVVVATLVPACFEALTECGLCAWRAW